jgi:hypothetical protein
MIKQSFEILSPYAEKLNELLVIQPNTDIASLAPVVQSRGGLFSSFFTTQSPPLDAAIFAKKVENWGEYLLAQWINATKSINREQLEKLKMVALKIHEEKKVGIIRKALAQLQINDDRINTALATLENRVSVILAPPQTKPIVSQALNIEKHPQMGMEISYSPPDSDSYKYISARSFSETDAERPFLNSHYDRRLTRHIDARILDIQTKKENKKKLAIRMHDLYLNMKKEQPIEYGRFLSIVKTPEEWHAYGRALKLEEANELLGHMLNDFNLHRYIPRFIMCLRFEILENVLHSCSHEQLRMINGLFIKCTDTKEEWFIERYKKKRQKFADISNTLAAQIDSLDERFRRIHPTQITLHDIKQMDQLVTCIELHKQGFEAFSIIVKNALRDHTTLRLITGTEEKPSDLAEEYRNHIRRMSSDPKLYSEARGCPYEIINGMIFSDRDLDDADDAAEIFAAWGILNLSDYEDAGLVTELPENVRREWRLDPSLGHKMARCFALKKLAKIHGDDDRFQGIYLWKHLRIYNKFMLKQYLSSPEMQPHFRYATLHNEYIKAHAPKIEDID